MSGTERGLQILRALEESEAPWRSLLVADTNGTRMMLVSARVLPHEPEVTVTRTPRHLLAPLGPPLSHGGEMMVPFPLCRERLDLLIRRRRTLHAGELVTIAVSVLRGLEELAESADIREIRGTWWLTAEGRSVFAINPDAETSAHRASMQLIRSVADAAGAPMVGDALLRNISCEGDELSRHEWEARLFSWAAPMAVRMDTDPVVLAAARGTPQGCDRLVDAEGAALVRDTLQEMMRSLRSAVAHLREKTSRRRRHPVSRATRRPLLALAALGFTASITGVTLLAGHTASSPPQPAPSLSFDALGSSEPSRPGPSSPGAPRADPVAAVAALLDARRACGGAVACLSHLQESAESLVPSAGTPADAPASERELTLIDDYGGAVAVRVTHADGHGVPQIVVAIRLPDRWILRSITPAEAP